LPIEKRKLRYSLGGYHSSDKLGMLISGNILIKKYCKMVVGDTVSLGDFKLLAEQIINVLAQN
jgi:hypothetical protein